VLISKFGRPTNTKAQNAKLQELLVKDVMETLLDTHANQLNKAGGPKAIADFLNKEAANVVKKFFDKQK
jgi:hypothetical protein